MNNDFKLDIKIYKENYMTSAGSTILRGMSPVMPMLDIFVREALQNSFDARNKNEKNIIAKFDCGNFNVDNFCSLMSPSAVSQKIKAKSFANRRKFLSVRDYNTTGLTGAISLNDKKDNDWGNFLKLIRNFGKSKKEDGQGGSWGYGKTTFYKIGIGMVAYYTRIKTTLGFEERLMICEIENEEDANGVLHGISSSNTGIAWWGKLENKDDINSDILPLTNHDEIMKVLSCFNIKPYVGEETGTAVIIPFINEEELLNKTTSSNEYENWCKSIEQYLEMAIQRWYPTRMNNNNGKSNYIDCYINDYPVQNSMMYSLYSVIQNLYNYSLNCPVNVDYTINNEEITYKTNVKGFASKKFGNLYYCQLDEEQLDMTYPAPGPSPIAQITNERDLEKSEKVIVAFCRKPGMILKYDYYGEWVNGIKNPDPNKYLICLFIPNSDNTKDYLIDTQNIKKTLSFDDYLRACESALHNDWVDVTEYTFDTGEVIDTSNLKLVKFIQNQVSKLFNKVEGENETQTGFVASTLNQQLANFFLPKKGFGNKSNKNGTKGSIEQTGTPKKKSKVQIGSLRLLDDNKLSKDFIVQFNKSNDSVNLEFKINTDNGDITVEKWEEDMNFPITLKYVKIDKIIYKDEHSQIISNNFASNYEDEMIVFDKKMSSKNTWYSFKLGRKSKEIVEIEGKIIYEVIDPSISISIAMGKED